MTVSNTDHLSEEMSQCVENCFAAAEVCEHCADACIEMGDEGMSRCIQLCRDVADVTTLHARFMLRESEHHAQLAAVCADLCEDCADECSQHDEDHCQQCVDVLRRCAESCREMASI